ncbi:hypothetical protein D3C73_682360 [compost metagenome]
MDVLDAVRGLVDVARLATAGPLIRRIRRDRDVALIGQALGIQAGDLLLHPAIGMRHDDGRVLLRRVIMGRGVDVGGDVQAVESVGDRMDVDLAWFVLHQRACVGQGVGIVFVVRGLGVNARHADHGGHECGLQRGSHLVNTPDYSSFQGCAAAIALLAINRGFSR